MSRRLRTTTLKNKNDVSDARRRGKVGRERERERENQNLQLKRE